MLNVIYSRSFYKSLKKKDNFVREKARERIRLFREDPHNILLNNHALTGEHKDKRSFNVTGDYRIMFYQIDQNTVYFTDIGTHPELYG